MRIMPPGRKLRLNVLTARAGSVRVEVVGPNGKPIPGRSFADGKPLYGDHAKATVHWGRTRTWATRKERRCFSASNFIRRPSSGWSLASCLMTILMNTMLSRRTLMLSALARGLTGAPLREAGRHLLLDPRVVEHRENAELRMGTAVKESRNPLFGEDKPWEVSIDNLYANVFYDEEERVFKCWYNPFIYKQKHNMTPPEKRRRKADYGRLPNDPVEMAVCYATSQDGVKWLKPNLGLTEFHDSRRNNIVVRSVHGPVSYPKIDPQNPLPPVTPASQSRDHWTPHGAGVWKDLADSNPARRYKMFFSNPRKFLCVSFSADGLHWSDPYSCPQIRARADTHNNSMWSPELNRYIAFTRDFDYRSQARTVIRTESPDFLTWTSGTEVLRALPAERRRQTYTMIVFPYGNAYLAWVMMMNRDNSIRKDDLNDDTADCELAWSADTLKWERILPGTPVIPRGAQGSCDFGCIYGAAYPIARDGKLLLYYGGSDWKHSDWRVGSLCLATMRADGFAGIEPRDRSQPARVATAPVHCASSKLEVSADCAGGSLQVILHGSDGRRIARSDSISGDFTDSPVRFPGVALQEHVGKPVRLEFLLKGGKLYSFRWG